MDVFDFYNWSQRKLAFHGSAVEIACACEELVPAIDHLLHPFREADFPDGFVPLRGVIEPYDLEDVLKHLSIKARPVPLPNQAFELYRDADRYFRLDDSVGLTMVDLVRRRWHCWLTPEALAGDPVRLIDSAVLWPLAQLVAQRELNLVPAVSVVRDGFGVLLMSDLSLELELTALLSAGYKIVGQRWTGLREEEQGKIAMLHLPGHILEKASPIAPNNRSAAPLEGLSVPSTGRIQTRPVAGAAKHETFLKTRNPFHANEDRWVDLHAAFPRSLAHHAYCDLILVCGAGRRDQVRVKQVGWAGAMNVLRRAWPTVDLPPGRRGGKLVSKMASRVRVVETQLSREPGDLLSVLDLFRRSPMPTHLAPATVPAGSRMVANWSKPPAYRPAKLPA